MVGDFKTISDSISRNGICRILPCTILPNNQNVNINSCSPYISPLNNQYTISGTYTETIKNNLGCDSIYLTINLTILNSPNTSFTTTICNGDAYTWNGQQYTQAGQYTQTLTNQFGCDSLVSLTLNINTNNNITITPNPAFGNAPLNVAFANQTPNLSNYNFTWYFGDGTSQQSNAPFLSHTYTQDGYADVTVVAENLTSGCTSTQTFNDMIFVIGGVNATQTETIFQFNIYPNPTNGVITLQSAPELMGNSFTILDFMGRILMKDTISNIKQDIDMMDFAKGTYYLKIEGALLNIEKLIKN
jgi:hypothetical protein